MWPTHYIPNQPRLEGSPPPRFYLTTPPYPIEVREEFGSAADFVIGGFGIGAADQLESAASFVGGEIQQFAYDEADAGLDELESAAQFVGGELVSRLVVIPGPMDELESAASFVTGTLETVVIISYDNWPLGAANEALLSGASFVGGVLA
jgi:hypothetical protein